MARCRTPEINLSKLLYGTKFSNIHRHAAKRHLYEKIPALWVFSNRKSRLHECARVEFLDVNPSGSKGLHV